MSSYSTIHYYASPSVQYPYASTYATSPSYVSVASPSEPMYRYGSSDGSSYTHSTPTSPVVDQHGYTYQDDPQYYSEHFTAGSSSGAGSAYHSNATPEYTTLGTVEEEQQGES